MARSTHRIVVGALAVSFALLASACSSGGSDGGKTTKAGSGGTTTTAVDAEAQARADSVDLALSDFPEGWQAAAPAGDDEASPIDACDPALGDRSVQLARHTTDDFSTGSYESGDGVQVAARTAVFEDEDAAKAAVAPFRDTDVIACIDKALKSAYTGSSQVTVTGTLEKQDADFDVDEAASLSGTYKVAAGDGSSLAINIGVLVLREGDIATNLVIQTVDPDFDVATLPVDTLVDQLNAA